jgi:hypothetical protein
MAGTPGLNADRRQQFIDRKKLIEKIRSLELGLDSIGCGSQA